MPGVLFRSRLDPGVAGSGLVGLFVDPVDGDDTNPGTEVAPFETLTAAKLAVRALTGAMSSDLIVYLRGGVHRLTATEAFTPADSGLNGHQVIWRNYPGEQPRISGGVTIGSWVDQGGGLWRAPTSLSFRQMYVEGVRAIRARDPDAGSYNEIQFWNETDDEVQVASGHVPDTPWARLNQVELVILGHGVNQSNQRISTAASSNDVVVGQDPERSRLFIQVYPNKGPGNQYWFENALEFCTAQGEWYLDTVNDFVYYRPRTGENMATAVVYAPQVETLFSVLGTDLDTPVHDLEFHGIVFEHATWLWPDNNGFVGDQASTYFLTTLPEDEITSYPSGRPPAAVVVNVAADLRFDRCIFRHCGADGLQLYRAVIDTTVIGCVFHDLSGSGLAVDLALLGNTGDSRIPCRRVTISNNYITKVGRDYYQSVGIMTGYVDSPIIEYNEVSDLSYVGISVGWGWSYESNTMASAIVRRNHLWDCCKLMADSAAIYTLSDQNGALVEHNYIHGIVRTALQGSYNISDIYLDEGSGDITVQNNVCTGEADTFVFQNANGPNVTLSNNDASDPGGVIAGAGLQAGYADIRDLVE